MGDPMLGFSHPELALRWEMLVKLCWERSWSPTITSGSRSYEQQKAWYALDQAGKWPTGPVANPDQFWGWTPWGWKAYGSLHMIQSDNYSHALDVVCKGPSIREFHDLAWLCGLRFPERGENWHCQWWGNDGVYSVYLEEPDMTLEEWMRGVGRVGDGIGCLSMINGVIHEKLSDGQWYALADVWEFIHRHMKNIDEGATP